MAGATRLIWAIFAATGLGGETKTGRSVEMAMMHAITWRPLA
jgi:hypothetical protein